MKRIRIHHILESLRKNWEFSLALFLFLLIAISIWVEFTFFKFNLYSFLFVVNFNLLLLFITLYIVAKRLFRLVVERKRKIFGSHLRSRLVAAFVLTSLIPGIFIFII
ncbi:MAG: PAS domain-containing sensor histidine kinase, partial [Desulfovibrionaceae bacterium]|nr:PAS domain-containing sensor histidine kinase [Desulfovibrionaceae bacterium]